MQKTIGITLGDVWGIGPEVISKSLREYLKQKNTKPIKIFADQKGFKQLAKEQNFLPIFEEFEQSKDVHWVDLGMPVYTEQENAVQRAKIAQVSLDAAIDQAMQGNIKGFVTAPLDKKVMQLAEENFVGHTEYLQQKTKVQQTWMMLSNDELNIVLLSNHVLLRDVVSEITEIKITQAVQDIEAHFKQLGQHTTTIAVCALNPHCGELSQNSEEKLIIEPAIKKLQQQGLAVEGPFSADSLFYQARRNQNWTVILAMYHDQGLVAAKYPGTDQAINITLGLPFIRVSPAHGVAYDLVGYHQARHESMLKAMHYILGSDKKSRSDV